MIRADEDKYYRLPSFYGKWSQICNPPIRLKHTRVGFALVHVRGVVLSLLLDTYPGSI